MEKPPIRILQRPCAVASNNFPESTKSPSVAKTLEQREADYAAARLRIMGSELPGSEGTDLTIPKGNGKGSAFGVGQNGTGINRQSVSSLNNGVTSATPLMSIQATPITTVGTSMAPDCGVSNSTVCSGGNSAQSRTCHNLRQSLAIVNVAQKLQPQSSPSGSHTGMQQRVLSASASSPAMLAHSTRNGTHPVPLFHTRGNSTANTGLLPNVSGFNYTLPGTVVNGTGLHHSHSATAFALMQQISLLQQYQQTLNGFQNPLLTSVPQTSAINQMNFPPVASQTNKKYAYPPAFN